MHQRSLAKFDFDSILLPWNWVAANHPTYPAEFEKVISYCTEQNVAVQTIKAIARGPWGAGVSRNQTTWYHALEKEEDINNSVSWVLSDPRIFLNSVGDIALLPLVLQAASQPKDCPDREEMVKIGNNTGLASIFGI